jgi:hypothetical protein
MRIRAVALGAVLALVGLCCGTTPAGAATAGHGAWTTEQRWGPHNDWEPNIAAAPGSPWLYQMTTQYGGHRVCAPDMNHCILFRSSPDRGGTWDPGTVMPRTQCAPGRSCRQAAWQNDPALGVSASRVIYAAWMNGWDVVFAKSRDHGRTWTGYHDFRRALGASFTDKPWITISPGGRDVYVAFNQSDSFISASHDYGRTWSTPVRTDPCRAGVEPRVRCAVQEPRGLPVPLRATTSASRWTATAPVT